MSSPFVKLSQSFGRAVPSWTPSTEAPQPSPFSAVTPFGTVVVDLGYGSGGYGDLPYGQNAFQLITVSTEWLGGVTR